MTLLSVELQFPFHATSIVGETSWFSCFCSFHFFMEEPPPPRLAPVSGAPSSHGAGGAGTLPPGRVGISGLHSRLPRGVRPRLEGKPRTPLSSRVGALPDPAS